MSPNRPALSRRTYVDLVLAGEEDWRAIDAWVERWHNGESDGPLHEFLGMTAAECGAWAADARNITAILYARRRGVSLGTGIGRVRETGLAARTSERFDPTEVQQFLRSEGIIAD